MYCHLQLIAAAAKAATPFPITSRSKHGDLSLGGGRQEVGQQCIPATRKAKHILVYISRSVASRWKEGIHPLSSSLVRPLLECCVQLWASQHKRDIDILEQVH